MILGLQTLDDHNTPLRRQSVSGALYGQDKFNELVLVVVRWVAAGKVRLKEVVVSDAGHWAPTVVRSYNIRGAGRGSRRT